MGFSHTPSTPRRLRYGRLRIAPEKSPIPSPSPSRKLRGYSWYITAWRHQSPLPPRGIIGSSFLVRRMRHGGPLRRPRKEGRKRRPARFAGQPAVVRRIVIMERIRGCAYSVNSFCAGNDPGAAFSLASQVDFHSSVMTFLTLSQSFVPCTYSSRLGSSKLRMYFLPSFW